MIEQQVGRWVRQVWWVPGHDNRKDNCGIHAMHMVFLVRPPGGEFAVVAEFNTGWMPDTAGNAWQTDNCTAPVEMHFWEYTVHWTVRQSPDDFEAKECKWLGGRRCFCSGGWPGTDTAKRLVTFGDWAVWPELEQIARERWNQWEEQQAREARLDAEFGPAKPHPEAFAKPEW